jgi:hypothetical protein
MTYSALYLVLYTRPRKMSRRWTNNYCFLKKCPVAGPITIVYMAVCFLCTLWQLSRSSSCDGLLSPASLVFSPLVRSFYPLCAILCLDLNCILPDREPTPKPPALCQDYAIFACQRSCPRSTFNHLCVVYTEFPILPPFPSPIPSLLPFASRPVTCLPQH